MSVTGMCFFFRGSCLVWGRVSRHLDEEGYERRLTDLSVGEWAVCVLCVCVCVCVLLCVCVCGVCGGRVSVPLSALGSCGAQHFC